MGLSIQERCADEEPTGIRERLPGGGVGLVCGLSSIHTVAFCGLRGGKEPLAFVARPGATKQYTLAALRVAALRKAAVREQLHGQLAALQCCGSGLAGGLLYRTTELLVTALEGADAWRQMDDQASGAVGCRAGCAA